ncbi:MAG: glucose-6-phosphate dehydrogenase [Metallibacterium sp.]
MHEQFLLFGATGDLAAGQVFPALANLLRDRLLPANFRVHAVAKHPFETQEAFRVWLLERVHARAGDAVDMDALHELLQRTDYTSVDLSKPEALGAALKLEPGARLLSYLAVPPDLFVPIAQGLKAAGLLEDPARLLLEKPIGRDLASARAINAAIAACVPESRVFRLDHYLGKATVQNLLALRFGNTLLEAVWSRRWIERVDILVAETAGVDGREQYYSRYGALRDMVQNHMLQLLCLVAMEPPSALDADTVRDQKLMVLRALRPFSAQSAPDESVRGVYQAGVVGAQAVGGFSQIEGQSVETFVALRAHIDNWRWAGVPFNLVTGKRLATRSTQIVVTFKPVSHWLFEKPRRSQAAPNRLLVRLQPEENIELHLMSSLAGPEWGAMELQSLPLNLSMAPTRRRRIAYERLFLDALNGRHALFVRDDEVEAAWQWIDSIADAWRVADFAPQPYVAGSWGPRTAAPFLPPPMARAAAASPRASA